MVAIPQMEQSPTEGLTLEDTLRLSVTLARLLMVLPLSVALPSLRKPPGADLWLPSSSTSSGTGVKGAPSLWWMGGANFVVTVSTSMTGVWGPLVLHESNTGVSCAGSAVVRRGQLWESASRELRVISRHQRSSISTSWSLGSDSEKWWEC